MGRVRAVHRLCELYPGICLATEDKTRKNNTSRRKFPKKKVGFYTRVFHF